ncbi:MAG: MBL fold metallo-hydrolase [Anaerolineaceae bacterium]|nr:MBL fold metallo-hydrolase [Anaerolineaceae bacterium]
MEIRILRYHYTNSYLIPTNSGWLMFDCDCAGSLPAFYKALKSEGISVGEINYLLISHFHPDHAGLAQDLKELGISLIVMEEQRKSLHVQDHFYEKAQDAHFKPISEKGNTYLACGKSRAFLKALGLSAEILHTPGHSEDSISLVLDGQAVFHGDLPSYHLAEGYDNLKIRQSWYAILEKEPQKAYSGHWPVLNLLESPAEIQKIA